MCWPTRYGAGPPGATGADGASGEPIADLAVRSSSLHGIDVDPAEVAGAIDEIPILCLAAAVASGRSRIRGSGELRHKESDRVAGIVAGRTALGARIRADGGVIEIEGGRALRGARHRGVPAARHLRLSV